MDEAEINARKVVPWGEVCALLGVHDRQLSSLCAKLGIPQIRFSQRARGLLLNDIDELIVAHARKQNGN